MRKVILFFLLLITYNAFSQIESERNEFYLLYKQKKLFPNESKKSWINASGIYDINSNAITNDFTKSLFFRGFIDDKVKDEVSSQLKSMNRFGLEGLGGLTYKYQYKKDLTIVAGIYHRELFASKFTNDAFELVFRGNSMYSGRTAQLSGLKINSLNYQSLYLGAIKEVKPNLKIGGGVSFIRGGNFRTLTIKRGSVYTDTAGAYLDFDLNFNLQLANNNPYFSSNGIGGALNFYLMLEQEKGVLTVEVRDLGIIQWNKMDTYRGNSTYHYDGVQVDNLLNFGDSSFVSTKADSVAKDLGIVKEQKGSTFFIPATFNVSYLYNYSEKFSLQGSIRYMLNVGYLPRVSLKGIVSLSNRFVVTPAFAYGGFGRMDFELGAAKFFKSELAVSANLFLLEYLAWPKHSAGQGVNLSITKLF
jgi:hypothetical protein